MDNKKNQLTKYCEIVALAVRHRKMYLKWARVFVLYRSFVIILNEWLTLLLFHSTQVNHLINETNFKVRPRINILHKRTSNVERRMETKLTETEEKNRIQRPQLYEKKF